MGQQKVSAVPRCLLWEKALVADRGVDINLNALNGGVFDEIKGSPGQACGNRALMIFVTWWGGLVMMDAFQKTSL